MVRGLQSEVATWGAVAGQVGAGLLRGGQTRPDIDGQRTAPNDTEHQINSSSQVRGKASESEALGCGHVGAKQGCVV